VVLPAELEGGFTAEVRGRLVFRGTCTYLDVPPSHGGPELRRIVWPTGTTWQEKRSRAVILPNGEVLRNGDLLSAAGGFVPDTELGLNIGEALAVQSLRCDQAVGTDLLNNDLTTWVN